MEFFVEESDKTAPKRARRWYRNTFCFTAIFSLAALLFESLKPYTVSQVTALEKQFGLSSTRAGMLVSSDQIGFLCAILFFGHCGRSRHIPKILAFALFLFGISSISTGLVNFAYPVSLPQDALDLNTSKLSTQKGKLCQNISDSSEDMCLSVNENADDFKTSPRIIFVLLTVTMIIRGVGKSPSYTLGLPFVDNNSRNKQQSSMLTGVITTVGFFGLSVGFLVGGFFSNLPVDLSDTNINRLHPSWIGAWWIGFLFLGGMAVLVSIPIAMFPKRIKKHSAGDRIVKPAPFKEEVKDLHKSMLRVIGNPPVALLLIANCSLFIHIGGSAPFVPKYIETQYKVPAFIVNIIMGCQAIIWTTGGTLTGAILTSKLKLTNKGCVLLVTLLMGIVTAVSSFALRLGCDNQPIKGIGESRINMTSSTLCQCDEEFIPVCGSDSVMYSSPCTAGCRSQNGSTYLDCSEISGGEATAGWCERDCYFIPFMIVNMIKGLGVTISFIPSLMTLMKLVEMRDKSMAVALSSFINGLLGFLASPVMYGAVIDGTCSLWHTSCGSTGACLLYDIQQMRYRLKGMDLGFLLLTTCAYVLSYLMIEHGVSNKNPE